MPAKASFVAFQPDALRGTDRADHSGPSRDKEALRPTAGAASVTVWAEDVRVGALTGDVIYVEKTFHFAKAEVDLDHHVDEYVCAGFGLLGFSVL